MRLDLPIIGTILKKDFLSLWPLVLLGTLLFAGDVMIVKLDLLALWDFFQMPLILLVGTVLIISVFQLDAPVSLVDDWLCRPIPRKELLAAKLLLVFSVVYLSRVVATFAADLMLGYGLIEALLEAVLLQDMFFMLVLPFLLITAVVTNTLIQAIGVLVGLFIAVFVLPTPFIGPPGPLEPGIGDGLGVTGLSWMVLAPAKTVSLLMVALCYWLVYWRRQITLARGFLVATTALTLFCVTLPMFLLPWDTVYSLQAGTLARRDRVSDEVIERIALRNPRACFPATTIGELSSNTAFSVARQFSGLSQWSEEALEGVGPDTVTFLTGMEVTGLPLDWRAKFSYVEAKLHTGGAEARYSLRPARYITDNGGGDLISHNWLLPQHALQALQDADELSLELRYSLAVLEPQSFELATDGVRRRLPGLGYCSATVDFLRNRIEMDCFTAGRQPAQVSAELFDVEATRVYSPPDYAPALLQRPRSSRVELAIDSPRLAAHDKILVTAWHSAGYVQKSWSAAGILGDHSSSCPLPSAETGNRLQRSRWTDAAPHETLYLAVDQGVQLEVLDFGGEGTPMLLLPGLGATAHSFDDIGPKLAQSHRVFAMTRRGTGASSKVDFGYDQDRLARDAIAVMDALEMRKTVVVGASIAGDELTWLGGHYPDRVAALVYLDAAYDRSGAGASERYRELSAKVPPEPPSRAEDLLHYEAFKAHQDRRNGLHLPEGELIAFYNIGNPYLAGVPNMEMRVAQSIQAHIGAPDYAAVQVPALALYATQGAAPRLKPWYDPNDEELMAILRELGQIAGAAQRRSIEQFRNEVVNGKVVELPGAEHGIWMSNEADVLREIEAFLGALPRD